MNVLLFSAMRDCMMSRPPINGDLQGPTVYSYNIPKDKPEMTSFPAYTFGSKIEPERGCSCCPLKTCVTSYFGLRLLHCDLTA